MGLKSTRCHWFSAPVADGGQLLEIMDLVLKSAGALALLLAWAGAVPFEQVFLTLGLGYLILSNMIVLAGPPVY